MSMPKYYERMAQRLLAGMPRPRPFCKLVDGRWLRGHASQHRTPQGVKWNRFWRIKQHFGVEQ